MNNNQNYNYYNPTNEDTELQRKTKNNIDELEILSFIIKLVAVILGFISFSQTSSYDTFGSLIVAGSIVLFGWIIGAFLKWCSLMLSFTKKK